MPYMTFAPPKSKLHGSFRVYEKYLVDSFVVANKHLTPPNTSFQTPTRTRGTMVILSAHWPRWHLFAENQLRSLLIV